MFFIIRFLLVHCDDTSYDTTYGKVEIYIKMEMSFIKITSILNEVRLMIYIILVCTFYLIFQILLLHCCSISLLGFLSNIYNHDVWYNYSGEELAELDETLLIERATIVGHFLPTFSIFTAVFLFIARYSSEKSSIIVNKMRSLGEERSILNLLFVNIIANLHDATYCKGTSSSDSCKF